MADVRTHYAEVLSPVYAWMLGGFDAAVERNTAFFAAHGIDGPKASGIAVDLGAGCGFQSLPLARLGFSVTAIDLDGGLLAELEANAAGLGIRCIEDDLLEFRRHVGNDVEIAVCMTDTLLHLSSQEAVGNVLDDIVASLLPGGRLIATFRDLTPTLHELDRLIPVRADRDTIFTCFLEYEAETVKVHDLVYRRSDDDWQFSRSFYRKLRLAPNWVADRCREAGFADVQVSNEQGLVTLVATR